MSTDARTIGATMQTKNSNAAKSWQGEGYYTVSGHKGAAFCDTVDDLETLVSMSTERDAGETVLYRGGGMAPDDCLSYDVNKWCDIDDETFEPCYDGDGWFLLQDIADAKTRGDVDATREAVDRFIEYVNDGDL